MIKNKENPAIQLPARFSSEKREIAGGDWKMTCRKKIIFFALVSFFSFFARLLPHAPNFAPLGALSILGGMYLPKKYALFLPLSVMLFSDFFLGFYSFGVMIAVYLSFPLYALLGNFFGKEKKIGKLSFGAFLGAILFFLITNFAVWAFTPFYQKDLSGLILSYTLALPFFKNTLFADLFFTGSFFVIYELLVSKVLFDNFSKLKSFLSLRDNRAFVKIIK